MAKVALRPADKAISLSQLTKAVPDLIGLRCTGASGQWAGRRFYVAPDGRWSVRGRKTLTPARHPNAGGILLISRLGPVVLEKAGIRSASAGGFVEGRALSIRLERGEVPKDADLTRRTFVRTGDDIQKHVVFPRWWVDSHTDYHSRAVLPLDFGANHLEILYLRQARLLVFECRPQRLNEDSYTKVLSASRWLFSYLTGTEWNGDSADAIHNADDTPLLIRWHPGQPREEHHYSPIPTSWAEFSRACEEPESRAQGPLSPEVISRCLSKLLVTPALFVTLEYLLRFPEAPVGMRGAFLAIALESLAGHILREKNIKTEPPLDSASWRSFCGRLTTEAEETASAESWNDDQRKIIRKRIKDLNFPTNAEKLALPFRCLGVPLSSNETKAITARNVLLHTGTLPDPQASERNREAWRKAYVTEMQMYTAVNKLLLKYLGYQGPVIDWGETPIGSPHFEFSLLT